MKPTRRAFLAGTAAAAVAAKPAVLRAGEPLTISAVSGNSIHWVHDAAIEKGYYREVGFEPELVELQSSPQSIQLAIVGAYHVASSQPEPFVAAVEHGATGLAAISAPMNHADWALSGAPGVKSLDELRGRLIGVSSLRTSEVWLTTQLMDRHGIKKGAYDFITAGTSSTKIAALQNGSIAAAVLYQPSAALAASLGFPALARYDDLRAYPPVLYVVNRAWAAHADAGKRVAHAIQRAHEWLWNPENQPEAIQILAKYTQREPAMLEGVYAHYFSTGKIYSKRGEIDLAGFDLALADMAQQGDVLKPPPPAAVKYVLDRESGGLAV